MKRLSIITAFAYFLTMAVVLTFPGLSVANRVEPYVLGLPFVLAWYMAWMLGALIVFYFLYHTHYS